METEPKLASPEINGTLRTSRRYEHRASGCMSLAGAIVSGILSLHCPDSTLRIDKEVLKTAIRIGNHIVVDRLAVRSGVFHCDVLVGTGWIGTSLGCDLTAVSAACVLLENAGITVAVARPNGGGDRQIGALF